MNSFTYDYPVRNYFGEGAMDQALDAEMGAMGKTVMLAYGGGSVKRTGVYGHVVDKLTSAGKRVVDFGGIMPNPTYEKSPGKAPRSHARNRFDFILAVGGGRSSTAARWSPHRRCLTTTSRRSSTPTARYRARLSPWAAS